MAFLQVMDMEIRSVSCWCYDYELAMREDPDATTLA